jgi:integrase
MRQTKLKLTSVRVGGKRFWQVVSPKLGGGRHRRTFKDRIEAQTYFDLAKTQLQNFGTAAMSISDGLRHEAIRCAEKLRPFGKTLTDATTALVAQLELIATSQMVTHCVNELLAAGETDKLSVRYLRDLKSRLGQFVERFGTRHIASITTAEIDDWLRTLTVGAVARNTTRRRLVKLFKFAKSRGWCQAIPAAEAVRVREIASEVGILTPTELRGLLQLASQETLPYWAIGAFAGLRSAELERLTWADINLRRGWIKVGAKQSKTASKRLVDIQPNLAEWLRPYASQTGHVAPANLRKKILEDRDRATEAGVLTRSWPSNALRHSFASYHLAEFSDAAKLALQLGHTGPALIFQNYREVVTPDEAHEYWSIVPARPGKVVSIAQKTA